mgnify:CR=1 FL=1
MNTITNTNFQFPGQKSVYLAQLDGMERETLEMKVPKSIAGDYYTLRTSIDFVRNCLMRDTLLKGVRSCP